MLLAPNECLEKLRLGLIKIINDRKIKLTSNVIFISTKILMIKELYTLKQKQVTILINYLTY